MKKITILSILLLLMNVEMSAQLNANRSANSEKQRNQAIKLNLVSPFYGTLNLSWQKSINTESSFQLTASYTDFDSYGSTNDESQGSNGEPLKSSNNTFMVLRYENYSVKSQRTQGFTIVPEYRYALTGRAFDGFYIAPFSRYMYYEYTQELNKTYNQIVYNTQTGMEVSQTSFSEDARSVYSYHSLGFGVTVGKQILFKNRVVVDLFAGPCYSILLSSNTPVNATSDIVVGTGIPNLYIRGYGVRAGILVGLVY